MPGIINFMDFVLHLVVKDTTKLMKHYVLGWVQSPKCNFSIKFLLSLKRRDDGWVEVCVLFFKGADIWVKMCVLCSKGADGSVRMCVLYSRGADGSVRVCVLFFTGADGSVRMFDLRHLEHSTIIYEDPQHTPLLRLAWNKQDPNYLATVAMDACEVSSYCDYLIGAAFWRTKISVLVSLLNFGCPLFPPHLSLPYFILPSHPLVGGGNLLWQFGDTNLITWLHVQAYLHHHHAKICDTKCVILSRSAGVWCF